MIARLFLVALVAIAGGCADLVGPSYQLPPGTHRMDPLPQYATWWADVEACSGHTRPMADITFYVVPERFDFWFDGAVVSGLYLDGSKIILADYVSDVADHVRHEMLHAVLRVKRGDVHPAAFFVERCGHLVTKP